MIISRYLLKEVLSSLLAVTIVLLLIFLSNQWVRYLSYAASGKIATALVMRLMGFEIPYLLALLLPLGLYLGIILAYGRLYADSEMSVMQACGIGQRRLVGITLLLAFFIAGLVLLLMLLVNPAIALEKNKGISQNTIMDTLRPGRFQVLNDGRRVVYVEKISRDRQQADNLFIAEEQKSSPAIHNGAWIVVSAARGYQEKLPPNKENFIVSHEGFRYAGTPGENAYSVIKFAKYAVRIPSPVITSSHEEAETITTHKLWQNRDDPIQAAELQWRLSIPLSVVVLMLLAIPLSHARPRQSRYTNLLPAVLLYIVYVNLLFVARNWIEIKMVPIAFGMWWVHLLILALAGTIFLLQKRYQLQPWSLFNMRRAHS
ncbi:MAG: LPS export ABC transporter permease LptF [Pseudomonadota bacterium]